jgi:hypothetical protein
VSRRPPPRANTATPLPPGLRSVGPPLRDDGGPLVHPFHSPPMTRTHARRGTSTHDGTAVAFATLHEMAARRVPTLFVTHYPMLAELEACFAHVANYHMAFLEEDDDDDEEEQQPEPPQELPAATAAAAQPKLLFLYKLARGVARRSFGLNVARMAVRRAFRSLAAHCD